jgi:hypothetical protein
LNWFLHYSITPPLHHSSGLAQGGKSMEAPSGGSSKPGLPRRSHGEGGSFGSGFFTVLVIEYLRFVCNLVLGVWEFISSATRLRQ